VIFVGFFEIILKIFVVVFGFVVFITFFFFFENFHQDFLALNSHF